MQQQSPFVRHQDLIRWGSIVLILLAVILLMRTLPAERLLHLAKSGIDALGIWGPLVLGALYVLATVLFVPGWILTVAAGALYGLLNGLIIVSLASTTGAALAFLIARYLARDRVRQKVEQSPKLEAVDATIGDQGWKIVLLLRLSPAIPFNLQNYLYGVTAIRFWPCVLASWVGMLPGTFMYIYIGWLGKTAAAKGETSLAEWTMRIIGLVATVAVTVYITRLARRAIEERTEIEDVEEEEESMPSEPAEAAPAVEERAAAQPWGTIALAVFAVLLLSLSVWANFRSNLVKQTLERLLGFPPTVAAAEAYERKEGGPTFDHSTFDALVKEHVAEGGWVDYQALRKDKNAQQLDEYLDQLAEAPFEELGRDEKLALLINAYNAFTLRLILDHWGVDSIRDIPSGQRWEAVRWQVGDHTWSLNQIEHEQIRPKFREPRIHFALVCAAVGCPPLRREAYTGDRIDQQLADQTEYVHAHPRWFRFDQQENVVHLTSLYDWYASDFTREAPSVLDYAARIVPRLRQAIEQGRRPTIQWIPYEWALNSLANRKSDGT